MTTGDDELRAEAVKLAGDTIWVKSRTDYGSKGLMSNYSKELAAAVVDAVLPLVRQRVAEEIAAAIEAQMLQPEDERFEDERLAGREAALVKAAEVARRLAVPGQETE